MRPGFVGWYYLSAINIGSLESGPLTMVMHLDTPLTYLNATPTPSSITSDSIVWTGLPAIAMYEQEHVQVSFQVSPNVNLIGMPLHAELIVRQDSVDLDPSDNSVLHVDTISGAYDPNDKLVDPEDVFNIWSDSLLNYTIRFQNTGTDTAFNITIVDTLPAEVSVGTFSPGASSHPYTYELSTQGVLKFHFENVLLPDSNVNEPLSHGLVSFSVRPDAGLPIATVINNEADFYFDFNPPIRTPPAVVSYGIVNSVPMQLSSDALRMYPLPVLEHLTIEMPDDFHPTQVWIHDLQGREIERKYVSGITSRLYLSMAGLRSGLYVLTVSGKTGMTLSGRFIKQ